MRTVVAKLLVGMLALTALTMIMIRGMWIDAMEHRRTNLRD